MEHYRIKKEQNRLWLSEESYSPQYELKTESLFAQCNGYMGVRAVHPFYSIEESRGMFLCGAFDKAYEDEVTELVNCPDVTWFGLEIGAEKIHMDSTKLISCNRRIDILSGELELLYEFELTDGQHIEVECKRFASMNDNHIFVQSCQVKLLGGHDKTIKITTGINGQITNSGVSHFHSVNERVYDKEIMESCGQLTDESVTVLSGCEVKFGSLEKKDFLLKRRSIYGIYSFAEGTEVKLEKVVCAYQKEELESQYAQKELRRALKKGYEELLCRHKKGMEQFWKRVKISAEGMKFEEEAAIYLAQYHMLGMTPPDTLQCSIAAKGLTGEGYKGHVFWDAETFVLPFLLFTYPERARKLLEFRYHGLEHAKRKAEAYGYSGAMFPWEAAKTGEEETPLYAALNIHTGKANRVWSGIKEYHVTADIIYAVEQYFSVTQDVDFMEKYGYEMIFEAAKFWVSCAKWDTHKNRYVICDVIGPDEYTEHVDNNAYTNYMAEFCVNTALQYAVRLNKEKYEGLDRLNQKTGVMENIEKWKRFLEKIYLPKQNRKGIIPQDDTFLTKPVLKDIEKYKSSQVKQSVLMDYSRDEVVNMQVLKQADVVMLLNLFPSLFPPDIVRKNVLFYEKRTIHDSSLSYCAHAQACACIGDIEASERFFQKALSIDLNDNPHDSTDGIHSASMGGIWTCIIYGFAGIHYENDILHIRPNLPKSWNNLSFKLVLHGCEVQIAIADSVIILQSEKADIKPFRVCVDETFYLFDGYLKIERKAGETERWQEMQKDLSLTLMG